MSAGKATFGSLGARLVVWVPYLWLVVFFLVPFAIVLKISLSQAVIAQPPYEPTFDLSAGWDGIKTFFAGLDLDNYTRLVADDIYWRSYLKSLTVAAVSTAILLAIGYPLAYGMARASRRLQSVLVMLVILPFWTSFLIRVYAWKYILQIDGLLNRVLAALHLVDAPVAWLDSDTAMFIGIVYSYLPFMVLPLYATLEKMDLTLLDAAADLGARPMTAFWRITVPLSLPGIVAGALLCFIPITGEFVIPDLLAGSDSMMIGQTLWNQFFLDKDWPGASAIAVVLLILLVGPILVYQHVQTKNVEAGA
jgi:putrescine transport system permease protein